MIVAGITSKGTKTEVIGALIKKATLGDHTDVLQRMMITTTILKIITTTTTEVLTTIYLLKLRTLKTGVSMGEAMEPVAKIKSSLITGVLRNRPTVLTLIINTTVMVSCLHMKNLLAVASPTFL